MAPHRKDALIPLLTVLSDIVAIEGAFLFSYWLRFHSPLTDLFPVELGFPPLEAMSCGTPVIAAMNSSLPEVLGDAAVYVNPFDTDQIARAFFDVLRDAKLRLELIKRGLVRSKKFTWEQAARQTLQAFEEITHSV